MAADTVSVRPAADADVAVLVRLLVEGSLAPAAEDPASPSRYVAALARIRAAGGEVLVAVVDGLVVGVLEVLVLEHLQHAGGRAAELESVHVAAEHRGQGVGAALVAAAVEWSAACGCYRVQLTSNAVRDGAHRFYEANGFVASHIGFKRPIDVEGT